MTCHVDHLHPSGTTRVSTVTERPRGKAVNVARVLYRLGEPTRLAAPAGGGTGDQGSVPEGDDDPARAARTLSLGDDGVVAASPAGVWEARPASALVGNPTGVGDAVVAGLAPGLLRDPLAVRSPERVLQDAVALSAAAVLSPEAGDADPAHHAAQLAGVVVRALDGPR